MSEVDTIAATTGSAPVTETFSSDYVAKLKAELEAANSEKMGYKNKLGGWESQRRAQLQEMQPIVSEWIKEGLEAGPEFKHEMQAMESFGTNLHQAANLDSAMPLARIISCHSAKIKREREEFSQTAGATEALGKANKEIDTLKDECATQKTRIGELEGLVAERTGAAEKLQEELSKAGLVQQKFDFSNAASRESAPAGSSSSAAAAKPAAPMMDPLLAFVQKAGTMGSGRIGLSNTGHHMLGAQGATGEADITAALRFA